MTEIPVKRPKVPPMAEIMSKMVVRSSKLIWVMIGVSKKKFNTAISSRNRRLEKLKMSLELVARIYQDNCLFRKLCYNQKFYFRNLLFSLLINFY